MPSQDTSRNFVIKKNLILQKAISIATRSLGLQPWPSQVTKVKQLYNQLVVRHGVMLVGPSGGGKTTARVILQRALVSLPMILRDDQKQVCGKTMARVILQRALISLPKILRDDQKQVCGKTTARVILQRAFVSLPMILHDLRNLTTHVCSTSNGKVVF